MLKNIELILLNEKKSDKKIDRSEVYKWMRSNDLEVLGAVYELITEKQFYLRIHPHLEYLDYKVFLANYFKRCILENPSHDSDWADTRYTASWAFANWFKHFWNANDIERSEMFFWKKWLIDLYNKNNSEIKDCIDTAILEPICKKKDIKNFFKQP